MHHVDVPLRVIYKVFNRIREEVSFKIRLDNIDPFL